MNVFLVFVIAKALLLVPLNKIVMLLSLQVPRSFIDQPVKPRRAFARHPDIARRIAGDGRLWNGHMLTMKGAMHYAVVITVVPVWLLLIDVTAYRPLAAIFEELGNLWHTIIWPRWSLFWRPALVKTGAVDRGA